MRKIYRDAIIGGIVGGVGVTIILYLIRGEVAWAFLVTYPIFFAIAHLACANVSTYIVHFFGRAY